MWRARLKDNYDDNFGLWKQYSDIYGLAERLGYDSAQEAWDANPTIHGSANPSDFKVVREDNMDKQPGKNKEADNNKSF